MLDWLIEVVLTIWLIEVVLAAFDQVTLSLPLGLLVGNNDDEGDSCDGNEKDNDEDDGDKSEPAMCTIDWGDCRDEHNHRRR